MNELDVIKETMLNIVIKLNEELNDDNKSNDETKKMVSISTAATTSASVYLKAKSLELRAEELASMKKLLNDKNI